MKTPIKTLLLAGFVVAAAAAVSILQAGTQADPKQAGAASTGASTVPDAAAKAALPRLVDLGADKCIPCKKMIPVLETLKKEYAGRMKVEFIDVWKNPDAGKPYKIKLIPTQIFYDASGKELFRHEGFFSKEDILAKWKELGVDFQAKPVGASVR